MTPASQPGSVAIAGTLNSEMGCAGDWDPGCPAAALTLDPVDQIWKKDVTLPAGPYSYKAALDGNWTENYGDEGRASTAPTSTYETATAR